jgi:uncharacterized protein (DUF362 family)
VGHDPGLLGSYPTQPPFDPEEAYPESPYEARDLGPANGTYRLVRETLRLMRPQGFGTAGWNPLGHLIHPGNRVLLKPNLVDCSAWEGGQMTHPAFLRPVIDYVYRACGKEGKILLAEGPWAAGVFDRVVAETGIQALVDHLASDHGVPVTLVDLNRTTRETTPLVDLGRVSELRTVDRVWYDAHGMAMEEGQDPGIGRYRISPAVLEADVVVCLPKAKVHCSGGITVAMKNVLGIIPAWDGPHEQAELKDCAHTSDVDRAGGRRGMYLDNDTIWRSMADLNRILLYADASGNVHVDRQRRYLAIVDAIAAAEESQYDPHPYPLNTVLIGHDPVTVDAVTARCMGFDPRLLKSVAQPALRAEQPLGPAHPSRIKVTISGGQMLSTLYRHALTPELHVFSWQGHVEAEDYDPPELREWGWDAETGELGATLGDLTGVAWVRAVYEHEGETRVKALDLRAGTTTEGRWSVPFPLGGTVRRIRLEAGDELFNECSLELTLQTST